MERVLVFIQVIEEFRDHRAVVQFAAELLQDGFMAFAAWPGEHLPGQFVDPPGQTLVTFRAMRPCLRS